MGAAHSVDLRLRAPPVPKWPDGRRLSVDGSSRWAPACRDEVVPPVPSIPIPTLRGQSNSHPTGEIVRQYRSLFLLPNPRSAQGLRVVRQILQVLRPYVRRAKTRITRRSAVLRRSSLHQTTMPAIPMKMDVALPLVGWNERDFTPIRRDKQTGFPADAASPLIFRAWGESLSLSNLETGLLVTIVCDSTHIPARFRFD